MGCDGYHSSARTARAKRARRSTIPVPPQPKPPTVTSLFSRTRHSTNLHQGPERRQAPERRSGVARALLHGSFQPRRQGPRRAGERRLDAIDWHHPWWLVVGISILLLCCTDAALTLMLIDRGAFELNPLLAPLVNHSPVAFVLLKVGLTGVGIVCLTLLVRSKVFGRFAKLLLYAVLIGYVVLIVYELKLLALR